jgi:hypothetical protein
MAKRGGRSLDPRTMTARPQTAIMLLMGNPTPHINRFTLVPRRTAVIREVAQPLAPTYAWPTGKKDARPTVRRLTLMRRSELWPPRHAAPSDGA